MSINIFDVAPYLLGGMFVAAGLKKVAAQSATSAIIKTTSFYPLALKCGLRFDKANHLNAFTFGLGLSMIMAGALYIISEPFRPIVGGFMIFLVSMFTGFVVLGCHKRSTNKIGSIIGTIFNTGVMGAIAYFSYGGYFTKSNL